MPRKRRKENSGLPTGWRLRLGAYRYMVPKGQEHLWAGKREFTLGKTLSEAHRTFAGRIATYEGSIQTIGQLIDSYLIEVTPHKSKRTQLDERKWLERLRKLIGTNFIVDFRPHNAYQLRDFLKNLATKGSGRSKLIAIWRY